jgi:C4-dicarboxylate-specific signal transduction histidine kinase
VDALQQTLGEVRGGLERIRQAVRDLKTFSRGDDEGRRRVELRPALESSIKIAFNEIRHRARLVEAYRPTPLVLANEARLG